ncbi:pancreatic secretory granule membrane major glycoprotein GP2-like [Hemitrygon akajei]|uniref:pancreatic secretory granule membrane major glycoprotein GP2-like n=1 Tax=Hemitrygon akajei TaxID=2704970 RepID=UPI003BF9F7B2
MGDGKLEVGWYRFNSSRGRMISETVFPGARCSRVIPGWLNGSHPSVEEGEVTRTVCFTWRDFTCYWRREIKVKNCCRYFVYQLKPAPCSSAVYCTAPETTTTEQAKLTSTEVSTQEPSTAPREEPSLEEEHTWIEVLVAASGGMTDEEVREATRQKLREMFGDPDPQLELVLCMSEIPEERGATHQRMKKSTVPSP